MSRFAIENIPVDKPGIIIKLVFFGYDYQSKWMNTSTGKPQIASAVMSQLVTQRLERGIALDDSFFNDYIATAEKRMLDKLISVGMVEGASERVHKTMSAIFDALRAIVVADNLSGRLRVQCLNKDAAVTSYDRHTQIVYLGDLEWNVAKDLPEKTIGQGGSSGNSGNTRQTGQRGGTVRTFGETDGQRGGKPHGDTGQDQRGGTVRTFGGGIETGGLSPRNPVVRWWRKHSFAVLSMLFFAVLAFAIVYGLLRLQKRIETLPTKPLKPRPVLIDSTAVQQVDILAPEKPKPNNSTAPENKPTPKDPTPGYAQ